MIWVFLGLATLAALVWGVSTAYFKQRALALYHGGHDSIQRSSQPPAWLAEHAQQLDQDLQELQRLHPGLAGVDRKYLGQPLEETQSYLYTLAMVALQKKDEAGWNLVVRLLNEIWRQEREATQLDIHRVATLNQFQQRVLGLYATASLRHKKASLPQVVPTEWTGRTQVAHRLLFNFRAQQWEEWQVWGGLPTWYRACQVLERLDRWDAELDSGQPLSPPTPELQRLYEALIPLQKGP